MLDLLRDHWGLTDLVVERAPGGTMNEVYVVSGPTGRFVLRGHRRLDDRLIEREHDVMAAAHARGIPAPRTVETRDGARFVRTDGGRRWSLLEWLAGEHAGRGSITRAQARSMGTMLARIHDALADVVPPRPPPEPDESTADVVAHAHRLLDGPAGHDPDARRQLEGQIEWLGDRLDDPLPPRPRPQPVHGDYHDANVLFVDDTVSGVIDWDKAEARSAAEEVLRAAHLSFGLERGPTTDFLGGYRAVRVLDDDELDAGAARYGYERDRSLWLLTERFERGNPRAWVPAEPFRPFTRTWAAFRST